MSLNVNDVYHYTKSIALTETLRLVHRCVWEWKRERERVSEWTLNTEIHEQCKWIKRQTHNAHTFACLYCGLPFRMKDSALAFRFHCIALWLVHSFNQYLLRSPPQRVGLLRDGEHCLLMFIKQIEIPKLKITIDYLNVTSKHYQQRLEIITIIHLDLSNEYRNKNKIAFIGALMICYFPIFSWCILLFALFRFISFFDSFGSVWALKIRIHWSFHKLSKIWYFIKTL